MYLSVRLFTVIAVGACVLHGPWAGAAGPGPQPAESHDFPLSDEELTFITAHVMARHPMLSSSPGVKYAEGTRIGRWHEDSATVIFHPHTESAGIKEAFQVHCERQVEETAWVCGEPTIRRYLSLDSQRFEVRLKGSISSAAALALIEATRAKLPAKTADNSDVPDSAMIMSSDGQSGFVSWVNFDGQSSMIVNGHLIDGGDPARSQDWDVSVADQPQ